jgi:hypothetical protein
MQQGRVPAYLAIQSNASQQLGSVHCSLLHDKLFALDQVPQRHTVLQVQPKLVPESTTAVARDREPVLSCASHTQTPNKHAQGHNLATIKSSHCESCGAGLSDRSHRIALLQNTSGYGSTLVSTTQLLLDALGMAALHTVSD